MNDVVYVDSDYITKTETGASDVSDNYVCTLKFKVACKGILGYNQCNVSGTASRTNIVTSSQYSDKLLSFSATANQTIILTIPAGIDNANYGGYEVIIWKFVGLFNGTASITIDLKAQAYNIGQNVLSYINLDKEWKTLKFVSCTNPDSSYGSTLSYKKDGELSSVGSRTGYLSLNGTLDISSYSSIGLYFIGGESSQVSSAKITLVN